MYKYRGFMNRMRMGGGRRGVISRVRNKDGYAIVTRMIGDRFVTVTDLGSDEEYLDQDPIVGKGVIFKVTKIERESSTEAVVDAISKRFDKSDMVEPLLEFT